MRKQMANVKMYIACLFVALFSFAITTSVSADYFNFDWEDVSSSGFVTMDSSDDLMTGNWGTVYNAGLINWNGSSAPVLITDTSFSNSNVDLVTVSEETWDDNGWGASWYAWAQLYNNGSPCNTDGGNPDTNCSTADTGAVYFNEGNYPGNATAAAGTVSHELGHIMALAHPSVTEDAIMHQSWHPNRTQYVTDYDEDELRDKY